MVLLCSLISFSQVQKKENDSVKAEQDIEATPSKKIVPKFFHNLIFVSSNPKKSNEIINKHHLDVEGKIIRNIYITTLDPFGYSDIDTTITPRSWLERTGNKLHLKSKKVAIKNFLLFKKNKPYSLQKIKESERLIRSQDFATSVNITERLTEPESDSVDVYVRVLDSWSTVPKLSITQHEKHAGFYERNFIGLGHKFEYQFSHRSRDNKNINDFMYTVPNIKNSYVKTILKYSVDLENYYDKSLDVERSFYSPMTKWAAGAYLNQQFLHDTLQNVDKIYFKQDFKFKSYDFWVAKAFHIFKESSKNQNTTNLIVSGRFLNVDYQTSPSAEFDPINFYTSEQFYLSGIGISSRRFIQDSYIFRNGIIEDVPIGKIYGITMGYQNKNNFWRTYFGLQYSFGDYYNWGFLSTNFEAGTFFNKSKSEQTAFAFQANYFTRLFRIGNWRIRQFVKPQLVIGINRKNSLGDRLNINEENGILGFNSPVYGTKKLVLALQTQSYSPKDIWGFRFNPYFNYSIAFLGDNGELSKKYQSYSKIGVGLLITNDYLVFSSFQISLAYYPKIPFEGNGIFRSNAFETSDFGLQSFELAKPKTEFYK